MAGKSLAEPGSASGLKIFEYLSWSQKNLVEYLKSELDLDQQVCEVFQDHKIDGSQIPVVSAEMLEKMGIKEMGIQNKVLGLFQTLQRQYNGKVFNDPIHGHFELHPLLVKVIDTPEFQRLRDIKQLGGCYYVFPGASHNRFEHSLGVCHIAGEFVQFLQRKQPKLGITEVDVLCVKMAGLCHDLGHGPFSHLFDQQFIPEACGADKEWKHEDASIKMIDHLLEENKLVLEFDQYGLQETDRTFIKEMIAGKPLHPDGQGKWSRPKEMSFLYEIVANKRNGVDVDKWDYFARDCHCLGIRNSFDMVRYMKFARVIEVDGERQICIRDKDAGNLYEMFHTRFQLHRRAYQHKTKNAIEMMITDALLEANKYISLPGKDGKLKMSEAIDDMTAYTRLTDAVLHQIMVSDDPRLEKSKQILLQIEHRKLYEFVGQTHLQEVTEQTQLTPLELSKKIEEELVELASKLPDLPKLKEKEDFQVQVVTFNYGKKSKNPVEKMRFYKKKDPDKAIKISKEQVSQLLPNTFQEKIVRVYCKKPALDSVVSEYFSLWCDSTRNPEKKTPEGPNSDGGKATHQ